MHAHNTKKVIVEPLLLESYLAFIKNSVGSKAFREFYCRVNGIKKEVMDHGRLSCTFYVTSVLKIFGLVKDIQITVHRAMDEMERSGWKKIAKPRLGAVIIWGEKSSLKDAGSTFQVSRHRHIGFYIGNGKAVSNKSTVGAPSLHQWNDRAVEHIFWHPKLQ